MKEPKVEVVVGEVSVRLANDNIVDWNMDQLDKVANEAHDQETDG